MSREQPLTWETVIAILDLFERAGFRRGDDVHMGRAIGLLRPVAEIYAGQRDHIGGDPPAARPDGRRAGQVRLVRPGDRDQDVPPMTAGGWLEGPIP
jgi:hypothetical protein